MGRHSRDSRPSAPHIKGPFVLTVLFSIAWVASFIAEIMIAEWEAPKSLDPIMLVVVSYYFTKVAVETRKNENNDAGTEAES